MTDAEFIAFVEAFDQCWVSQHLQDLGTFLAEDVVFVAPGGNHRITGIEQAVESYRQFLSHAQVKHFRPYDYAVTQRGDTAVVEYGWEITWVAAEVEHKDVGHDILVLAQRDNRWRVVWRTQIPANAETAS
jgi:ketosteroid isomerase-like protein